MSTMATYEIKTAIVNKTERAYQAAKDLYPSKTFRPLSMDFDLRGQVGGTANFSRNLLRFNIPMATIQFETYMEEVIVHEVAHLVAQVVYGRNIKPHGKEWKQVVILLGGIPKTTHSMDVQPAKAPLTTFKYECGCQEWDFTSIRHNRVRAGKKYSCPKCNGLITRA